jgi:hypothetical protein
MGLNLAVSVDTAFGLAFNVEKAPEHPGGFLPARFDFGARKELYGDLRLNGFAALLRTGFAKRLIIVGGDEAAYKDETPSINQGWAIREMLICGFDIDPARVEAVESKSDTSGNIAAIAAKMKDDGLDARSCAVVSNLYHLPRAAMDLAAAGLPMPLYPAESFILLEDERHRDALIERLEEGRLGGRVAQEALGIADKLRGTYVPHTEASPVVIPEHQKQE